MSSGILCHKTCPIKKSRLEAANWHFGSVGNHDNESLYRPGIEIVHPILEFGNVTVVDVEGTPLTELLIQGIPRPDTTLYILQLT